MEDEDFKNSELNINIDNFLKETKFKFVIRESFDSLIESTEQLFKDIDCIIYCDKIRKCKNS